MVDKFNVQVLRKELHSLKGLNWLNDAVIISLFSFIRSFIF